MISNPWFELENVGPLYVEKIFYIFRDSPILFVCVDNDHNRYLCSCCKDDEEWVVVKTTEQALIDLIDDIIPICDVFLNSSDKYFGVKWNGSTVSIVDNVSTNWLPVRGALLELKGNTLAMRYRILLEDEVTQKDVPKESRVGETGS